MIELYIKTMKTLRYYQQEALDAIWKNLGGNPLVSLPTGSGKALLIAELCKKAVTLYPETNILVLCPKRELVQQNYDELVECLESDKLTSIYCAGLKQKKLKQITVGTIQSIYRLDDLPNYQLLIVDEVHLCSKNNDGIYRDLFARLPKAKVIGLTATPYRTGSGYLHKGDGAFFDKLVYDINVRTLIKQGYLCNIISRDGSSHIESNDLHIRAGEYRSEEVEKAFLDEDITKTAIRDILVKAKNRHSIIIFACSIKHTQKIKDLLLKEDVGRVEIVTGNTKDEERAGFVEEFKQGKIRILINCQVYTTGFNAPNVDCIILMRATNSPGLFIQCVGRSCRKYNPLDNVLEKYKMHL